MLLLAFIMLGTLIEISRSSSLPCLARRSGSLCGQRPLKSVRKWFTDHGSVNISSPLNSRNDSGAKKTWCGLCAELSSKAAE